jgi:replication factor A1
MLNVTVVAKQVPTIGNPVSLDAHSVPSQPQSAPQQQMPQRNIPQQTYQPPVQQPRQPMQVQQQQQTPYRPPQQNMAPQQNRSNFPPQQNMAPQHGNTFNASNIHPIKTLNPYHNRWTIKARVTNKTELRPFNGPKGAGRLFSVDFLDASGGEIRATMFNEAADHFYSIFETDRVYLVSKGKLKPANKKFSSLKSDYELTLDTDAIVQPCNDGQDIPRMHFSFVSIDNIQNCAKDDIIDVLGVVDQMDPAADTITTKTTGKQLTKRNLSIGDTSGRSIEVTLWGERAENPGFQPGEHPILAIKGIKVSDFKSKFLSYLVF